MPSKKTKKRRLDGRAPAYNEDLGMQGIKTSIGDKEKSLTILERPLADDEEQRRLQRVVRKRTNPSVVHDFTFASWL
jgi:hypothetical protein